MKSILSVPLVAILLTAAGLIGCKPKLPGPSPTPTPAFNPNSMDWGVNIHINDSSRVDQMKQMGAKWVRMDIHWCELEPVKGQLDFGPIDRAVARATQNRMQILASMGCTPEWAAREGSAPHTGVPASNEWESFVRKIAKRYRSTIHALGIWNEPNIAEFWTGTASDYCEILLKPAASIIREEAPGVLVVGPELSHLYTSTIPIQTFLSTLKSSGAADQIDIISHHIYGEQDFYSNIDGYYSGTVRIKDGFKQMLLKAGLNGRRVWITEFGVDENKNGEQGQADKLVEQIKFLSSAGLAEVAFIFELDDSDPNTNYRYGLLRGDGTQKTSYRSIKTLLKP